MTKQYRIKVVKRQPPPPPASPIGGPTVSDLQSLKDKVAQIIKERGPISRRRQVIA